VDGAAGEAVRGLRERVEGARGTRLCVRGTGGDVKRVGEPVGEGTADAVDVRTIAAIELGEPPSLDCLDAGLNGSAPVDPVLQTVHGQLVDLAATDDAELALDSGEWELLANCGLARPGRSTVNEIR